MTLHPSHYRGQNLGVILILLSLASHPVCQEMLLSLPLKYIQVLTGSAPPLQLLRWFQAISISYQILVSCLPYWSHSVHSLLLLIWKELIVDCFINICDMENTSISDSVIWQRKYCSALFEFSLVWLCDICEWNIQQEALSRKCVKWLWKTTVYLGLPAGWFIKTYFTVRITSHIFSSLLYVTGLDCKDHGL